MVGHIDDDDRVCKRRSNAALQGTINPLCPKRDMTADTGSAIHGQAVILTEPGKTVLTMRQSSTIATSEPRRPAPLKTVLAATSLLTMLFVANGAHASVVFSDSTYNAADYTQAFRYNASTASSIFTAVPNSGLQFTMATDGPANTAAILHGVLNTTFVYDPMTQGVITSISASSSKTFTVNNLNPLAGSITYSNNFRPLVEQDGKFYAAAIPGSNVGPVPGGGSQTVGPQLLSNNNLSASDFFLLDPTNGTITGTTGLDFAGDTMTFGLVQFLQSAGAPDSAMTNYSDIRIGITSTSPVPLPASAPLFGSAVLALGAFGYGLRRRRTAAAA